MASPLLRDARSIRPYKSSEEYLYAMKEDLAEWLSTLYPELDINVDNFMDRLDTGVALCKHANNVKVAAEEYVQRKQARKLSMSTSTTGSIALPIALIGDVHYLASARPCTFYARDNVSNFINWCRRGLGVFECLLFETDDLILRKNEKHVILCLLDVARRGARLGMLAPMLVQLERQIDREIAMEQGAHAQDDSDEEELGPMPQIVTNDLKSLDEMVRDLVERCQCPVQFPMIRVSEGKYRIGDTKVLIFVRVLRNHVMVRVGGGWDTLSHYLDKHDPCRCKTAHRSPLSAKLILKSGGSLELGSAQVHYERSPPRTRRSSASSISSGGGGGCCNLSAAPSPSLARSRSPTPRRSIPSSGASLQAPRPSSAYGGSTDHLGGRATPTRRSTRSRSRSPTPTPIPVRPPSRRHSASMENNNATTVEPPPTTAPATDPHLNDSGSEVSDEGYRSLGTLVVTSPAAPDKKSEVDGGRQDADVIERPEDSLTHHTSSSDSVISVSDDPAKPTIVLPDAGKPSPRTLPLPPSPEPQRRKLSQPPPSSATTRPSASMTRSRSTCGDSGFRDSPPDSPRRSGAYRSVRTDPRPKPAAPGTPAKQTLNNTWSGRQGKAKARPALTDTTFSNSNNLAFGSRTSVQRRSLGTYGSTHSSPSRSNNNPPSTKRTHKGSLPSSLQTSPTKQISPLLEEILQVKELDNDVTVLLKMKEIIKQYADIVDEKLVEERRHEAARGLPPGGDELDFTSAWVHGNGSLDGIQQPSHRKKSCSSVSGESVKICPNPRKDSKPEGSLSRIPMPVFFTASDS